MEVLVPELRVLLVDHVRRRTLAFKLKLFTADGELEIPLLVNGLQHRREPVAVKV